MLYRSVKDGKICLPFLVALMPGSEPLRDGGEACWDEPAMLFYMNHLPLRRCFLLLLVRSSIDSGSQGVSQG